MTDNTFTPVAGQVENNVPVPEVTAEVPAAAPAVDPMVLKVNMELAKVAQDGRVIGLIKKSTTLQQFLQFGRIENSVQYSQAIDAFDMTKGAVKELESLRHEAVDFPTQFTKLTNQFFKGIRDGLEKTKDHLGKLIDVKKQEDAGAAARAQAAANTGPAEVVQPETPGDVATVQFEAPPVEAPGNVVESARGAKVHSRSTMEVKVLDLTAFLKMCVSRNKRNLWLSDHVDEFITVNTAAVAKMVKENKKQKVPGLEIVTGTKTV